MIPYQSYFSFENELELILLHLRAVYSVRLHRSSTLFQHLTTSQRTVHEHSHTPRTCALGSGRVHHGNWSTKTCSTGEVLKSRMLLVVFNFRQNDLERCQAFPTDTSSFRLLGISAIKPSLKSFSGY